jgi:hypothetical protein
MKVNVEFRFAHPEPSLFEFKGIQKKKKKKKGRSLFLLAVSSFLSFIFESLLSAVIFLACLPLGNHRFFFFFFFFFFFLNVLFLSWLIYPFISGGLELLMKNKVKSITAEFVEDTVSLKAVVNWVRDNLIKERSELFVANGSVRPGILVLVNDCDWYDLWYLRVALS